MALCNYKIFRVTVTNWSEASPNLERETGLFEETLQNNSQNCQKKGYWEHRCHHIKYIAVFSKKILLSSLHKCQFQVQRKRGSFLPRIGHPQYKQWDTIIGTMNRNFFYTNSSIDTWAIVHVALICPTSALPPISQSAGKLVPSVRQVFLPANPR